MRKILDWTYRLASIAAAASMVALLAVLALQISARLVGLIVTWSDDIAGFLLVATSFLALAGTFRNGGHVRVSLLIGRAGPRLGRWMELGCLVLCAALAAYLTYSSFDQAYDSFRFDEQTSGLVAFHLWLPQAVMSLGIAVFFVATLDALVGVARGERPVYAERALEEDVQPVVGLDDAAAEDGARRYAAAE